MNSKGQSANHSGDLRSMPHSRSQLWWAVLVAWLLLAPQLSLYVGYVRATWPFGNAIAGIKELRIEFGLLSVAAALCVFVGFFFVVFLYLVRAVWWKRLLVLIGFLASHLTVTSAGLTIYGLAGGESLVGVSGGGGFPIASIENGLYYLGPLIGCVSLLPAIIVQVLFGWQIVHPSKKAERSQVSLARLFEGVALCTLVTAGWYSLSGLVPGAKLYVGLESFGCLTVLVITSIISLALMRLMMASTSASMKLMTVFVLACGPLAGYGMLIGAGYVVTGWKMSFQDASLMGFACALACLVAEICIAVCWWLARQTGYRLLTG